MSEQPVTSIDPSDWVCPLPLRETKRILLGHGGGGILSEELIENLFLHRVSLVGVPRDEGDAILRYLYQHMENPLFQCRFRWEPRSLVVWDNYSTIHRGIFDFGEHHRLMHRVSFHDGWRPA